MNRYLHCLLTLATFSFLGTATAAAGENCTLGSQYLELAKARIASHAEGEAATFLQHSIEACPKYDAYELLGELSEGSDEPAVEKRGAHAFVSAYQLAGNDTERAHALYEYAKLLDDHGDAQNASPLILRARALDEHDASIQQLAARIDAEVQHPTAQGIVRGLADSLYVPLRLASTDETGGSLPPAASGSPPADEAPLGPSVNFPINFETNSTLVDPQTQANIPKLAEALRNPAFNDRQFIFIGYADIRGSEPHNLKLSQERAQAIYQKVVQIDPMLAGRVKVIGRGSADPIDPRHTSQAYRENRRLQVLLH
jgi:OmpA family